MMGLPELLTLDDVLEIHQDQIQRYGGSPELRDAGLLASAVDMPLASFGGAILHEDLFQMAAAYLYHIVQNHPFVDGNKRTGAAAALVFLDLNGVEIDVGDDELFEMVMQTAQGRNDKAAIAAFFRSHAKGHGEDATAVS
jgi:death on curing protein